MSSLLHSSYHLHGIVARVVAYSMTKDEMKQMYQKTDTELKADT